MPMLLLTPKTPLYNVNVHIKIRPVKSKKSRNVGRDKNNEIKMNKNTVLFDMKYFTMDRNSIKVMLKFIKLYTYH